VVIIQGRCRKCDQKKSLGSFQICSYCLSVAGSREQGLGGGLEVWGRVATLVQDECRAPMVVFDRPHISKFLAMFFKNHTLNFAVSSKVIFFLARPRTPKKR